MRKLKGNWIGLLPVVLSFLMIYSGFVRYSKNIAESLEHVNDDIVARRTVVLDSNTDQQLLSEIVFENGYASTKEDAEFISRTLVERQNKQKHRTLLDRLLGKNKDNRLESLWSLQKRDIGKISAHVADSCHVLSTILDVSRDKIGLSMDSLFGYNDNLYSGAYSIKVVVKHKKEKSIKSFFSRDEYCENVPVLLQMHYRDSLDLKSDILGCLWTDEKGETTFKGLQADSSYSVLPIKDGYEYGKLKGVIGGDWKLEGKDAKRREKTFTFVEEEHRIPMFINSVIRQIKNDRTIIVRTPDEFLSAMRESLLTIILSWSGVAVLMLVLTAKGKRRFSFRAGIIMACCMFLSGLCVLMMFSMQDPLNDELRGMTMKDGVLFGAIIVFVFQFVDFQMLYNLGKIPFLKWSHTNTRGIGWIALALIFTIMLFVPGIGQDVGGMRVNVNLFGVVFQPSEIAKYLIIMYAAVFFTENNGRIMQYSSAFGTVLGKKLTISAFLILGLLLLMVLYFVLSDMGPGLVIGVTFIILYSFCKSENTPKWQSDIAMLLFGTASFAIVMLLCWTSIGGRVWYLIGFLIWLAVWWFVGWISFSSIKKKKLIWKKQLFETPIMMNAIILLFVAGNVVGQNNKGESGIVARIGSRIEERTSMCINTWGGMDEVYANIQEGVPLPEVLSNPVSNMQVASSLWALASGGLFGQGWGNGKPNVVPAAHTDMILSSIGEQAGWIGLLLIVLVYWVLLHTSAKSGIKTGDLFSIYLSLGIVIVTAVQFFIIALGSAGVIPLTGVTVPLLSYGRVSMILNLAAFGIVLSIATKIYPKQNNAQFKRTSNYEAPHQLATCVFVACAVFTLCVWFKYQIIKREKTMIQPAYVINNEGNPTLEYNPRISLITSRMNAGRIFDRNGLLLATSDRDDINVDSLAKYLDREQLENLRRRHQKRYYPFGEHLFFMVGDLNSGLMFSYDENHPVGYMAEAQHLSYLRGFDNILYDKENHPAKIRLFTDKKQEFRLLKPVADTTNDIVLRDYTKLLPYLKDGSGKQLAKHNEAVSKGDYDLYLTVDAALQKSMQDALTEYIPKTYNPRNLKKRYNLMRVSVVVIDAKNGDLLASANYPLPDYERLRVEDELAKQSGLKYAVYSDNNKRQDWQAYTDRDLGTTYQTAPGSTAKVMSAMAGFRKIGTEVANKTYFVSAANQIEKGVEPTGYVTMEDAIVQSSNCYFVNLVNDKDLYAELETIYSTVGVRIGNTTPYYYTFRKDTTWRQQYHKTIVDNRQRALALYRRFVKNGKQERMNKGEWNWAWGQGFSVRVNGETRSFDLLASPLVMARVVATVVNEGKMPVVRYIMPDEKNGCDSTIKLMSKEAAVILKGYMKEETNKHGIKHGKIQHWNKEKGTCMGGKTGTAERGSSYGKINDGWYVSFIERDSRRLAVVVRMERIGTRIFAANTAVPLEVELLQNCILKTKK